MSIERTILKLLNKFQVFFANLNYNLYITLQTTLKIHIHINVKKVDMNENSDQHFKKKNQWQ